MKPLQQRAVQTFAQWYIRKVLLFLVQLLNDLMADVQHINSSPDLPPPSLRSDSEDSMTTRRPVPSRHTRVCC